MLTNLLYFIYHSLLAPSIAPYAKSVYLCSTTTAFGTSLLNLTKHIFPPCVVITLCFFVHLCRLNQCVGELNYKYFMLFLFTNAAFFYYGATVIFYVLISEVSIF